MSGNQCERGLITRDEGTRLTYKPLDAPAFDFRSAMQTPTGETTSVMSKAQDVRPQQPSNNWSERFSFEQLRIGDRIDTYRQGAWWHGIMASEAEEGRDRLWVLWEGMFALLQPFSRGLRSACPSTSSQDWNTRS